MKNLINYLSIILFSIVIMDSAYGQVAGDVIITEIMIKPTNGNASDGEWFEIYNTTANVIDINGWIIRDNSGTDHTINNAGALNINSAAYLVLGINDDTNANGGVLVDYVYNNTILNDDIDDISILLANGTLIDHVAYDVTNSGTFPKESVGIAISLQNTKFDAVENDNGYSWCNATSSYGTGDLGTPGSVNDTYEICACSNREVIVFQSDGTWSNGVGPDMTQDVLIKKWFKTEDEGNLTACNCKTERSILVDTGDYLEIYNDIFIYGGKTIRVKNGGSIVQHNNNAAFDGTGTFKIEKKTSKYTEYDYTYWSSPVEDETIQNVFIDNSNVNSRPNSNGDDFSPAYYILTLNTNLYIDLFKDLDFPQTTVSGSDGMDDDANEWNTSVTGVMDPGKGYAVMGAGSDFPFDTNFAHGLIQKVYFRSRKINNGDISVNVILDGDQTDNSNNQNFIGNPYPSAIDLDLLTNDPDNTAELSGTYYLWSHDSYIGSGTNVGAEAYNFSNDDYATYVTTTGGAAANGTTGGTNPTDQNAHGFTPTKFVASGQGFLADVKDGIIAGSTIIFKNSMRVTGNNEMFFNPNTQEEKDRLWLSFTNNEGLFRQILVAFIPEANDTYDKFDGKRLENGTNTDFYSLPSDSNTRLAVQGLGAFQEIKTVKLGIEISEIGIYKIAIDKLEGVFNTNQVIYIEDTYTNTMHNLKNGTYTFGSVIGDNINDRFVLHFTSESLEVTDKIIDNITIYPNPSNNIFNIGLQSNDIINIEVYDVTGKLLVSNINTPTRTIDLSGYRQGFYFAKISQNGQYIVKKLMVK